MEGMDLEERVRRLESRLVGFWILGAALVVAVVLLALAIVRP